MEARTATQNKNVAPKKIDLETQRKKDREIVKGLFHFYEVPGGTLSFSYRCYKGDPTENFTLTDGQVYSLPLGVARHLNKSGAYPVHGYAQDETGKPVAKIGKQVRRYGFQSLEFIDDEDLNSHQNIIVTTEI